MVGGVVRSKAIAAGALFYQKAYVHKKVGVVAGAQALKTFLKNTGAYQVGKCGGVWTPLRYCPASTV